MRGNNGRNYVNKEIFRLCDDERIRVRAVFEPKWTEINVYFGQI